MNFKAAIANALWLGSNLPAARRFDRALSHPAEIQRQLLRSYLETNTNTAFGKKLDLAGIRSYAEFTQRVPLHDYKDFEPWIHRIRQGEQNVLTADRVTHLVPTSGSSSARKLIPFTAGLQREFNRAINPWITDLYRSHPDVAFGPAYWSISPAAENDKDGSSAVPIGFEDDSAYLGGLRKRLVNSVLAVPSEIRLVSEIKSFRYVTLLCLLRQEDLRLISVWHPSFLSLLWEAMPDFWESLLDDIAAGTCRYAGTLSPTVVRALNLRPLPRRAESLRANGPNAAQTIWPHLKIISCWGHGQARLARAALAQTFPHAMVQDKGLLATECFVTIPHSGSYPLAVSAHFFEFIDQQDRILPAHELKADETYEVIVTTGGGLWRYRLGDKVTVTGFLQNTPSLRFVSRAGNLSDRFGEKLSEEFVAQVIQGLISRSCSNPQFALLAPDEDDRGCRYTLYLDSDVDPRIADTLDTLLCENPNYAWCRKLGQLGSARLFRIADGSYQVFSEHQMSKGMRLGDIKPTSLSKDTGWSQHFQGNYVE